MLYNVFITRLYNEVNIDLLLVVFLLIDILWLGFISKSIYQEKIGHLLKADVNWTVAILLYMLLLVGILFFVINPALAKESWKFAFFAGGFFGLITYATYDMTNLATLKDWPVFITVVDILWGTTLSALTSVTTFFIMSYLGGTDG